MEGNKCNVQSQQMRTRFNKSPYALVILPGEMINLTLSVPCENTYHEFCICTVTVHIFDGCVYLYYIWHHILMFSWTIHYGPYWDIVVLNIIPSITQMPGS